MAESVKKVTKKSKENNKLPAGAKVVTQSHSYTVEEIENGWLITKSTDISYIKKDGGSDYMYMTKKYYSKDEPTLFDDKKNLADAFDLDKD